MGSSIESLCTSFLQAPTNRLYLGAMLTLCVAWKVLEIVFAVLDVVATDDLEISMVLVLFIVKEVDVFEKTLLVVFELPHLGCVEWASEGKEVLWTENFAGRNQKIADQIRKTLQHTRWS